ncbi:MAG: DegT/DnrJ/EryC1/StrS aminotransferase family protein [Bacteroidota bacterium]|jgi:dTDP-4-amino-4,6-dideoxygalactose transaminase
MNIPLIKPYINDNIKQKVLEVLESGYLTEGPVTRKFEKKFSEYIGSKHSIAVTSCTTGLEIALRSLNIGPGDEVIVPDYTYPATASVVNIVGAKAVIVDIDKSNMLIDYKEVKKAVTDKTKAIISVSIFGNPLNYHELNKIKEKYGLYIIEDAACSVGAEFENIKVGNWADISVFSFHPRKFITTGEGGMITTNNDARAEWMNSYKHFGMNMNNAAREGIQFDIIGTNYKLSNILSAVGLGQLGIIDKLLAKRIELAENYKKLLAHYEQVFIPRVTTNGKHSYQSFCIFIDHRDRVMNDMRKLGIEVQIGTYSLHLHNAFKENNNIKLHGSFENSLYAFNHCLALPLYHQLTFEQQKFITDKLIEVLG